MRLHGHHSFKAAFLDGRLALLVKLEIQDAKDLVNFHITHFENQLKVHFSAIVDGIDQKLSESLGGSGTDISEINSRMKLVRTEVPKFVKNGLDSFVNVFKNLKSEFTVNKPDVKGEKNSISINENGTNSKEAMNSDNKSDSKDERIDLGSVPPEAIIRTIDMYLEDLKIEGDKLLNSLLNDKTKSRRFQQS
uniref:Uncharacterized protein n=1 Tax=Theileria annulata TaxID=5874 RepID=A0A3B0N5B5_THEAN